MIENSISYIQSIIGEYGAIGVFIASLIEQIIAPIPSSLIPMMAGFFLLPAYGSIFEIFWQSVFIIALPVTAGIIIGAFVVYFLGFFGGKPIIKKTEKWLGIRWGDIIRIKKKLDNSRSDELVLFALWLLPIIPGVAVSIFCGIIRYSLLKFIIIVICASFLRAIIMALIGWQTGELYIVYLDYITKVENYIFIALVFLVLAGLIYFIRKHRKSEQGLPNIH